MPRPVLSCLLLLLQQLACPVQQHDKGGHIVRCPRLQRLLVGAAPLVGLASVQHLGVAVDAGADLLAADQRRKLLLKAAAGAGQGRGRQAGRG